MAASRTDLPNVLRKPSSAGLTTSSGKDTRSRTETGADVWFKPNVRTSTDMWVVVRERACNTMNYNRYVNSEGGSRLRRRKVHACSLRYRRSSQRRGAWR